MNDSFVDSLKRIVGESNVLTKKPQIVDYIRDETAEPVRPESAEDIVVVKPSNTFEVAAVLKIANDNKIFVVPRGAGTGLVGGAVPSEDGIVLCLERMTKIEIDKDNFMAIVEAGLTLRDLIAKAKDVGLLFPLHPGDETAQVGGLAATNAGGANAIRYGVMRNQIRGIEVVLPSGEIMNLGGKLQKNNVGYDLMQLIIGSEGTLGIITKITLRLSPDSGVTATLIVPYNNRVDAINTVPEILARGKLPWAIEFVEKDLMEKTARALGEDWPVKEGKCFLLIAMEEANDERLLEASTRIAGICQESNCLEILFAKPIDLQEKIVRIRSNIYHVLKPDTADILDVTVSPACIGKLLDLADEIAKKHEVYLPMYGHVGDGNLHIHITKEKNGPEGYIDQIREEIYEACARLGGVITGEHGIGRIRTSSVAKYTDPTQISIMKAIKNVFDPNSILNPGVKIP